MKTYIYKIYSKNTGKSYVGATTNFKQRFLAHRRSLAKNKHHSIKLQRAYNKYGEEDFEYSILEETVLDLSTEREQFWIDALNSYTNGYNACAFSSPCPAGERNGQYRKSPPNKNIPSRYRKPVSSYDLQTNEIKHYDSVSEAIKEYGHPGICSCLTHPDTHLSFKDKIWCYTKDFSESWIEGKILRIKINKNIGQVRSDKARQNISNGRKGMKFSESHRNNIRLSRIGEGVKKIIRNDGKIYSSIKEAAQDLGIDRSCISKNLTGQRKRVKGYTFKYFLDPIGN